jgi:diguanylate cyclase (GGDEF)-like protein
MYLPELGRRTVFRSTKRAALAVAIFLFIVAAVAFGSNGVRAPVIGSFLPIVVTLSFCAEGLTALLLFAQFYLTGSIGFALLGAAFEFEALLAIPYLLCSPGVGATLTFTGADYRPMGWLWFFWHLVFALVVIVSFTLDPLLKRRLSSRAEIGASLSFVVTITALLAIVVAAFLWALRDVIPPLALHGKPTALFRYFMDPMLVLANAAACIYTLLRGKSATSLGIWIALATFAAVLDTIILSSANGAFSAPWYLAKIETMLAASIVLAMLFSELALVYGRLAALATRDALTGLHNRRGLDDYLDWAFDYARRRELGIALLVIDIDHFKRYNDRYGHASGDAALRRVAALLRKSAVRRYDLVARYGGEEFVVALFNVGAQQATTVADRLQKRIEAANIPHEAVESGRLSVSIGIGQIADVSHASIEQLFDAADRALYRAKETGRNRYVISTLV